MKTVYLDNSATTALCDEAKAAMNHAMEVYGNPSSLHAVGVEARHLLEQARGQVASALGIRNPKPGQLIFTSCGSEANNLAIFGSVYAKTRRTANRILTTDSEHPSVENAMRKLEAEGFDVVRIPTKGGVLDLEALREAVRQPILFSSMMLVNNETGARYNLEGAFSLIRRAWPEAVLHCDAVQGFLKVKMTPMTLGADLITLSAHKIHGPKGVGALYVAPSILSARKLIPVLLGGGQENGFRSGTENMVGICGFGAAAEIGAANLPADLAHMEELRNYALEKLKGSEIRANLPAGEHAPHLLHITLPEIKSETMLHFLSARGVCVSAGSACSSHAKHPSATLLSFGLTPHEADMSLRISFSSDNTFEDVDALMAGLFDGVAQLVKIRR